MSNFIEVYSDVYSKEYCEKIIELFNHANSLGFGKDRQKHDEVERLNKDDLAIFTPNFYMEHVPQNIFKEFNERLWGIAYKNYAEKYSILSQLKEHYSYSAKIQKTEPGQGYHEWHCESVSRNDCNRILAWAIYLNDDFEAGETEFIYQQYRYKPKQGDVIIFPAAFTHTHRGNPPINGTKYIVTGWIEF